MPRKTVISTNHWKVGFCQLKQFFFSTIKILTFSLPKAESRKFCFKVVHIWTNENVVSKSRGVLRALIKMIYLSANDTTTFTLIRIYVTYFKNVLTCYKTTFPNRTCTVLYITSYCLSFKNGAIFKVLYKHYCNTVVMGLQWLQSHGNCIFS